MEVPKRKHPAHGIKHVDNQPTIIFDTVCTKRGEPWLANPSVHALLKEVWREADAWAMGKYMILPNHIHFFAGDLDSTIGYESWVKYWKSLFSKRHGNPHHRWLANHWDTRVRNENIYEEKWEYVRQNPVRHGLVESPDDWPYQGEIHVLGWG